MYGVSLASWLGLTMSACQTAGTIPSSTIRETSHMPNAARRRRPWWPAAAFGMWLVSLIVLLGIVPAVWQALIVNPNQLAKETPYIAYNIAATRAAYDLTRISQTPYSLQGDLSAASRRCCR